VKRSIKALLGSLALVVTLGSVAHAAPAATAADEITHLFGYLERSGCEFERNGRWYDAAAAKAHLQSKYQLASAGSQIVTAEEFIERVASKSSMSGLAYEVRCNGSEPRHLDGWLKEALVAYRRG
jgi:hypothetical protein